MDQTATLDAPVLPAASFDPSQSAFMPPGSGLQTPPRQYPPAISTLKPDKVARLVQRGFDRFKWVREARVEGYRNVVGRHYGSRTGLMPMAAAGDMTKKTGKQAINLHAQHIKNLVANLANNPPAPEITANDSSLEFEATAIKMAMTEDGDRLRLRDKYQELVVEAAITGFAINKVGTKAGSSIWADGTTEIDPGEIYEEPVDIDDYVVDPLARRWSEKRFHGHRVRINKQSVLQSNQFGAQPGEPKINQFLADSGEIEGILNAAVPVKSATGSQGDRVSGMADGGDRPSTAGDEDDEMIEVWELFWYLDGATYRIVILAKPGTTEVVDRGTAKFLAIEEYQGPEDGPLEILTFLPIQSSIVPLSLDQWQRDLAIAMEAMGNKLISQALKAKRTTIYDPTAKDEVDRIRQAPDGEFVAGDPKAFVTVEQGGMMKDSLMAVEYLYNEWNNATVNNQLSSGQNDVGKTATAFNGLLSAVRGFLAFLQGRLSDFATRCLRRRVWWFITDPLMERQIPFRVSDTLTIPVTFSAEAKQGRYQDFQYKVEAQNMAPMDPATEAAAWTNFFVQIAPALEQGIMSGMYKPSILRVTARKFRLSEIDQALNDPQLMMQQMVAQQQAMQRATAGGPPASPGMPRTGYGAVGMGGGDGAMGGPPPGAGVPQFGNPMDAAMSARQTAPGG